MQLRRAFAQHSTPVGEAQARATAFGAAHDVGESADRLVDLLSRDGALASPRAPAKPHRPRDLARSGGGQIVVLGMHRSGTSSVAGLLARMGVWAGSDADLLIGPDNPKGHYELARLHGACLRRLEAAGGDWKHPPSAHPGAAIDAFRRDVGDLLETLEPHRPWLIKEPRLCLVARDLLPLLTRPVFVHVVREPRAVAASLAARDGLDPVRALALWEHYTRAAFAASRGWPRVLIDYADLMTDPLGTARRLIGELAAFGVDGLQLPADTVIEDWLRAPSARARETAGDIALASSQQALWDAIADRRILDDDDAAAQASPERASRVG